MRAAAPERRANPRAAFRDAAGLDEAGMAGFDAWRAALERWSARINLAGRATLDDFWVRHALDSLQVFQCAPEPGRWVDIGAGAGFPGLAIALMQKAGGAGETHLVESNGKKAAFLREAARATGAPATVHARRWQEMEPAPFDCVTARAFAPLSELLESVFTFWGPATTGVFPKGKRWSEELAAARRHWRFDVTPIASITGDGRLLIVRELTRV